MVRFFALLGFTALCAHSTDACTCSTNNKLSQECLDELMRRIGSLLNLIMEHSPILSTVAQDCFDYILPGCHPLAFSHESSAELTAEVAMITLNATTVLGEELNLTEVLEKWKRSARAHKHDHFLHVPDFLGRYFVNACEPIKEIQKYARRQTGRKGKDDNLKDLPESNCGFSNKVCTGRFWPTRQRTSTICIRMQPKQNLATNDEERTQMYDDVSEALIWIGLERIAMGKALTDVRAYHLNADRATLLASKKERIMTSTVSIDLNVIEKTDADIAVTVRTTHISPIPIVFLKCFLDIVYSIVR